MGTKKPSRPPRSSAAASKAVSQFFPAIRKGDLRKISALVASHPDLVSAKTEEGTSALLFALYNRQPEVADLLRSKGAALSIYDACAVGDRDRALQLLTEDPRLIAFLSHDGWTPLHLASFFGQKALVEFLLDHGADIHVVSKNEQSVMPLHSALANRQVETAALLIERGADIEARQPTYEYTPLHYAAANGLAPIVRTLLDCGAKITAEGLDGKRPIDLAKENGHRAVVALLEKV